MEFDPLGVTERGMGSFRLSFRAADLRSLPPVGGGRVDEVEECAIRKADVGEGKGRNESSYAEPGRQPTEGNRKEA